MEDETTEDDELDRRPPGLRFRGWHCLTDASAYEERIYRDCGWCGWPCAGSTAWECRREGERDWTPVCFCCRFEICAEGRPRPDSCGCSLHRAAVWKRDVREKQAELREFQRRVRAQLPELLREQELQAKDEAARLSQSLAEEAPPPPPPLQRA